MNDLKTDSEEYIALYHNLKFFDQVYSFRGSSTSKEDLKACLIEKCKVFLFIATSAMAGARDSNTVQTFLTIQSLSKIRFILEIGKIRNQ